MTNASEKLSKLRQRVNKPKTGYVEPEMKTGDAEGFTAERWYDRIRSNPSIDTVQEAGKYYDAAVRDGTHYVVPVGNLTDLQLQLPGLTFYYSGILVDAQQARRWVEERLDRKEAEKHNYYMYSEEAKTEYGSLKTTEASKLAKSDPAIMELSDCCRVLAFHEHNLERLMDAFDNIKYMLNNVSGLYKEGKEAVWVDPTKETNSI